MVNVCLLSLPLRPTACAHFRRVDRLLGLGPLLPDVRWTRRTCHRDSTSWHRRDAQLPNPESAGNLAHFVHVIPTHFVFVLLQQAKAV